jgi:LuxR family quorum-sensing system transcriptional regulator SolR
MDCWQHTQIQTLLEAKSRPALVSALARITADLGFEYFSFYLRLPLPITRPATECLSNYPQAWLDYYWEHNYNNIDPTIAHGRQSMIPILWQDSMTTGSRLFWRDAQDHGLRAGLAQPCHGPGGTYGLLNLGCSDHRLSSEKLRTQSFRLTWLAQAINQSVNSLQRKRLMPGAHNKLTSREIEVLRWTADGKTASEVGCIMGISERTVNFHVGNSLVKLDATNKTSAVIKAAMLGLL